MISLWSKQAQVTPEATTCLFNVCVCVCVVLRYLHNLLGKNQQVTEQNRSLLVETLRSISEILIWGDQNDSSVFE